MLKGRYVNFIATVDTIAPEQRIWVPMDFNWSKNTHAVDR